MPELQVLIEKISAGRASLDDNSASDLFKNIAVKIEDFVEEQSEALSRERKERWIILLSRVNSSRFAREIATHLDFNKFYSLGIFLIDKIKNEDCSDEFLKGFIHEYLDLFRAPEFLEKIYDDNRWAELIYDLITASGYNFKTLFDQRVRDYSSKNLFKVIKNNNIKAYSWDETRDIVRHYSKALSASLEGEEEKEIHCAFLLENSFEMACLDLACLTSGIVNVMVPANSVPQHISYILNQTKVPLLFVHDEKQLSKLKSIKNDLRYLEKVILVNGISAEKWVTSFEKFLNTNSGSSTALQKFIRNINPESLATIMYTSGTTGEPKGIMFAQKNIVYKRFCRAMAIPLIGDHDRFLSYLPLFHTFGRYLEMTGSIFWGCEYIFMEDPSVETMLLNMQMVKPTIFISIPKKWVQLYEYICSQVDIELSDVNEIRETVMQVIGGELKWGLSAAGYLPPEIFIFFQKNGVELMSGFGMTEATGGITMTPPNSYRENSLGKALPGIKIKTAQDGELLIKGNYVMMNYYGMKKEEVFDNDGWLPTGDIMREDNDGFIEIIDRKKEIYKNIKGETIAPQKIENFFREFENIKQVFLVGDHRPFNTLLIFPDYEIENSPLLKMSEQEKHEYFSSLVVTVNNFLAPFERIVDFRIIPRAISDEQGELTPKGTFKRRVIEKNFNDIIEPMYRRNYTELVNNGITVRIPNWFLREKGCLSHDISFTKHKLIINKFNESLEVKSTDENRIQIGDYIYKHDSRKIDFQSILINPKLWLGNNTLYQFAGSSLIQWQKYIPKDPELKFDSIAIKYRGEFPEKYFCEILESGELSTYAMHLATLAIRCGTSHELGIQYIRSCIGSDDQALNDYAIELLMRPRYGDSIIIRRKMLETGLLNLEAEFFINLINKYVHSDYDVLNDHLIHSIVSSSRKPDKLDYLINLIRDHVRIYGEKEIGSTSIPQLFHLLSRYGIKHPSTYDRIRQVFVEYQLKHDMPVVSELAKEARIILRNGFRLWLGENQLVAVDMETSEEYGWEDVIIFEEGIDDETSTKIKACLMHTAALREAIFLISKGKIVQLANLLPGGIWISLQREYPNKIVFRVSVQTRFQGSFELLFTLNHGRNRADVLHEINLHILAGSQKYMEGLVEDFGGYWEEFDLWTSKYIPGESVGKFISREIKKKDETSKERLYFIWPYFVWNAAAAYFNFWRLTGYKYVLSDPGTDNFIIPVHDYQTGTKVISLSKKYEYTSLIDLFFNFNNGFIESAESKFPFLKRNKIWSFVFAGIINSEGERSGLKILRDFKHELIRKSDIKYHKQIEEQLIEFIFKVEKGEFIPKQLYFAIKRFKRWFKINPDADSAAQAQMLNELYDTYRLNELRNSHPEVRVKLYSETVFRNSALEFRNILGSIIEKYRDEKSLGFEELLKVSNSPAKYNISETDKFFITRLMYPHLKPSVSAELVEYKVDGKASSNLVVQYDDNEGTVIYIRKPVSPREISRLHQIFIESNLLVTFKPEHDYLLAVSDRGYIIGGLFYTLNSDEAAHMEKIVVSGRYRRKGISDKIMTEFFERMKNEGIKYVTTGFFRPEYFYKFDFKVEKKYSGLVKSL
ncbi:MAG: GNAT family N-acetyltransferase [Melioribacteraceae bacterium]|nr:GNAT family N-acetyltransferase [Melioribacteraceae bacterium]